MKRATNDLPGAALFALALTASCRAPCLAEPTAATRWEPGAPPPLAAPPPRPEGAVRFLVGGDSRMAFPLIEGPDGVPRDLSRCDVAQPFPRALHDAKPAGASAFLYLGDMERTPPADTYFPAALQRCLDPSVRFCPVFGNHEALEIGELPELHPELARDDFVRDALPGCVGREALPAEARASGRVFYAVDLPGSVHFVALDNVSDAGFGRAQLGWLARDLRAAKARGATIVVGMHKALAKNGVTRHDMDEDGDGAVRESEEALAYFEESGVKLILASHEHGYWEVRQRIRGAGIRGFVTGGLGAPLRVCAGREHAFFHYLVLDVVRGDIDVHVVEVPGRAR